MRALLHTEFAALLTRAGVSQAAFARLSGYTPRQVNNWCRGRAVVPSWAVALAAVLDEHSPDAIEMMVEEALFTWHETLGVPPAADAAAVRRAMTRLAHRLPPGQRRHATADDPHQCRLRAGARQPGDQFAGPEAPSPARPPSPSPKR